MTYKTFKVTAVVTVLGEYTRREIERKIQQTLENAEYVDIIEPDAVYAKEYKSKIRY